MKLAVTGPCTMVNFAVNATKYQGIAESRYFDVMNIKRYNVILGTPFLFQHQIVLGFNPCKVGVGSLDSKPLEKPKVTVIQSNAADI